MRLNVRRMQMATVILGLLMVGVGGLLLLSYEFSFARDFDWVASTTGYGALLWASWALVGPLSRNSHSPSEMRQALRRLALGWLLLGSAYLGGVYEAVQAQRHGVGDTFAALAGDGLLLLGFCLTSVAFWTAARASHVEGEVDSQRVQPNAP